MDVRVFQTLTSYEILFLCFQPHMDLHDFRYISRQLFLRLQGQSLASFCEGILVKKIKKCKMALSRRIALLYNGKDRK